MSTTVMPSGHKGFKPEITQTEATKKTAEVKKEAQITLDSVDEFLDKILWFQKRFDSLTKGMDFLSSFITEFSSTLDIKEDRDVFNLIKDDIREIVTVTTKLKNKFAKTDYAKGCNSHLDKFVDAINDLSEQLYDLELRTKNMPSNKKVGSILDELKSL